MKKHLISTVSEFTAELADHLLAKQLGAHVVSCSVEALGEGVGLMSSVARAYLTLDDGREKSVVIKYVAETENASVSKSLNFYANEVNFYRHLATTCPVETPQCLFADIDEGSQDFLLILEDLGGAVAGDQLLGCDLDTMSNAFRRIGELHALYWGKADTLKWLNYHNVHETNLFRRDALFLPGIEPTMALFPEYFTGNLETTVRTIGEQFVELFETAMAGPQTVIHGDYRIDNMLLHEVAGQTQIVVVDWQNSGGGRGAHDIAYFSSQSCGLELRGEPEMQQLRAYHEVLVEHGVKDYSFDECLRDYRLNLLVTTLTPIAVCGTLDMGNERGVELGRVMLERALAALTSMECDSLLSA
jgi:hypothetical protein